MKILHISDLHFRTDKDQSVVTDAILAFTTNLKEVERPDLIVFSGDLVQAGGSNSSFRAVEDRFLVPLMRSLKLSWDRVTICPGNHDIDRQNVRDAEYIERGLLGSLRTRDAINSFIDKNLKDGVRSNSIGAPFERLAPFYSTIWRKLSEHSHYANPLLMIHKLELNGTKLGVCAFNTAWRCTGEADNVDRGHLILGERVVDAAVAQVAECDVRLAVLHHPLDWLVEDDRTWVEPRLHEAFDIIMYGHVHRSSPEVRSNVFGGLIYSQAGCLYEKREYYNGFSCIDIDHSTGSVEMQLYRYDDRVRRFVLDDALMSGPSLSFRLPRSSPKQTLNSLIARMTPVMRKLANDHFNIAVGDGQSLDIETDLVAPPFARTTDAQEMMATPGADEEVALSDLLSSPANLLVRGAPESGKTTVAHSMLLRAARGATDTLRLPLLANFRDFSPGTTPLWRAVRPYANEVSDGQITAGHLSENDTLIVVDGVELSDPQRLTVLTGLFGRYPRARWILLANDGKAALDPSSVAAPDGLKSFEQVSLRNLPRSSIRQLSSRWLGTSKEAKETDDMFHKVMEHIRRSGLPRTGYIVSLVLWTLKNTSSGELLNEAVLLGNIIDYLLNRMDYRGSLRGEFDFTSKVSVLQHLSYWMKDNGRVTATKNEIVGELITYLASKALSYEASKIIDGFISCGILYQIDDEVGFRYPRFQDYFVAGHLRDNQAILSDIMSNRSWRLYRRELDIYSSRFRHEQRLLEFGRDVVSGERPIDVVSLSDAELNTYMQTGSNIKVATRRIERMRTVPMTAEKIDRLKDRAEARYRDKRSQLLLSEADQKPRSRDDLRVVSFVESLELYSQFVRNLEFADSQQKKTHLEQAIQWWTEVASGMLYGIREVFNELRLESDTVFPDGEIPGEDIRRLITDVEVQSRCFVPSVVGLLAYHSMGSEKLVELMDDVAADAAQTPMARLVAVSMLVDLDPVRALDRIASTTWLPLRETRWVCEALESRLYSYYMDRPMLPDLNRKFVSVLADLEARITGAPPSQRGLIIQELEKQARIKREGETPPTET